MGRLRLFWTICVVTMLISVLALGMEVFVYDIRSMLLIYIWAGLGIIGFTGNAVCACIAFTKRSE